MVYESIILRWILKSVQVLKRSYEYSFISFILKKLGQWMKILASSSSIINLIKREGFLLRSWEYSGAHGFFGGLLNLPSRLLRKVYRKFEHLFVESLAFKLLKAVSDRICIFLSVLLFIVIVTPHQYWDNAYSTFGVVVLLLLFFAKTVMNENTNFYIKAMDFFLFVFILSVVLAEVFSVFPGLSLRFLMFYITCFLLVLLLVNSIETKYELGLVIEILLIGLTLSGVYGIWQGIKGVPVNPSQIDTNINEGMPGRIFSTLDNPNNFAEVLVLLIPFYAAAVINAKTVLKKLFFLALSLPPLVSLLLTFSRSGWIGFAITVLVFTFFKNKKLLPVMVLVGILFIPFLPQSIYRRVLTIWNPADSSTSYRVDIYRTVWPMFKEFWITGIGLGNDVFMKLAQNYYQFTKMVPVHSHNLFMQVWFETGVIGALSFMAFIIGLVKRGIKYIYNSKDAYLKNILIAGISSIAGITAIGLVEYVWFYPRVMLIFWVVTGIVLTAVAMLGKNSEAVPR